MLASASASTAIISTLLEAGAPWNALDRQGRCAGEYAVESQSQECCDVLVAAGVRAQLLFGLLEDATTTDDRTTARYLASDVQMSADGKTLADADGDAVMMEWERPLMEAHADVLCGRFDHSWIAALDVSPDEGTFAVLNVGHGMGIIDNFIQDRLAANAKATHTIIEPHDGVLASMRLQGWLAKPGVAVSAATWQAAFLDPAFGPFDAIFFDTYAESYADMQTFFDLLPRALKPTGVFSFFNGMCPFNTFFHGVACEFVKVQLERLGLQVDFVPIAVDAMGDSTWKDSKRRYWLFDTYHLPLARWKAAA